jgi:hypothetical protein
MQRLKTLGLASALVLVLSAIMATQALATAPEFILPAGGSFPVHFTDTSGESVLETVSKTTIKCTKGKSTGSLLTGKAGSIDMLFEECSSLGSKCNSTGSSAGMILANGDFVAVLGSLAPVEPALFVESIEAHIECELLSAKVKGNFLILIAPDEEFTELFRPLLLQKSGTPSHTTFWDALGEEHTLLETSISGGKYEDSGYGLAKNEMTLEGEVEVRTGTLAETDPVTTMRTGGTAGGTTTCAFTAIFQTCTISVENTSGGEIEISGQEVSETVGGRHLKESYIRQLSPTDQCSSPGFFYKGTELLAGTHCVAELQLVRAVPTLPAELRGGYYVRARQAGLHVGGSTVLTSAIG